MNQTPSQVLLVEDDPQMPEVLGAYLQEDHITIFTARDAAEGLKLARGQACDLILLDLGLPGVNGYELLRQLKECPETQDIPVIVLTAWNSTSDKLRGFGLGAVDYLTKPFEPAELRARVRAVLRAKQLQDELTQVNRDLVAARVAAEGATRAKADFLASMSHEIRTPMNGIIAMAGLLQETQLTREQQGYAETIYSSSESLLAIINDILDFSKIEAGKLDLESEPFDLRSCIEDCLDLLAPEAAKKKLELTGEVDEAIRTWMRGDVNRLRQVLVNLLSNGIKFTATGEVAVRVEALSAPEREGRRSEPWHLHFQVRDTGIGISVDRLSRLFKSFSQGDASTARHYGGTGLGLAISKRLVELMGGKMWVESAPAKGSTFHFTLRMEAVPGAPLHALEGPGPQLAGRRVLIVDDNATCRRILVSHARRWGMVPRDSQSGKEALGWLKAGECFDLAVLDLEMLEMDGVTLAEEIRKLPASQRMPVVLLTSLGVRPDQPELAKAGLAGCLAKPVKLAPFQEALRRALPGAQPPAAPEPVAAARAEGTSASPSTLRILVCDDNLVNQKVGLRLLQQIGHRATLAANGLEALAALERQPYDLIFMDVMMPEMDGLEATRLIRERQQQPALYPNYKSPLIIVAMTASAMHGDRDKCLAVGMDDYVAKPVRLEDLRQIVERWAEVAASTEPAVSGQDPFTTSGDTDSLVEANAASADAPVDMSRLLDFTDGNPENLRELAELYLSQTEEQLGQMKAAFHAGTAPEVRRLAHSCAGASATCGMRHLVPLLRELERLGSEGQLTGVGELCHQAGEEFDKIRSFLEAYLGEHASPAGKT